MSFSGKWNQVGLKENLNQQAGTLNAIKYDVDKSNWQNWSRETNWSPTNLNIEGFDLTSNMGR